MRQAPRWILSRAGIHCLRTTRGDWVVRRQRNMLCPWCFSVYVNGAPEDTAAWYFPTLHEAKQAAEGVYARRCRYRPLSLRDHLTLHAGHHDADVALGRMNFTPVSNTSRQLAFTEWRNAFVCLDQAAEIRGQPAELLSLLKDALEDARFLGVLHDYCWDHDQPELLSNVLVLQAMLATSSREKASRP